jgi:hypothetical protein
MAEKIGEVEKITVNVTYEWQTDEPKSEHELILFPDTKVGKLIERFEKKIKKSGLAFFHGDVKLNGASTFAECNIPAGAILTVRDAKRKREDSPPPVARSPTPPLPRE